jgi:hypothetical protein
LKTVTISIRPLISTTQPARFPSTVLPSIRYRHCWLDGWSNFRDHAVSNHMLNVRRIKVPDPHFSLGVKQNLYLALKQ